MRRPLSVTILSLGVLIIAIIHLVRFWQALAQWRFLELLLPVSPLYIAASGLGWFLVLLPAAAGLWLGKAWAPPLARLASIGYSLYHWTDSLILRRGAGTGSWLFELGVTILVLTLIFAVLSRVKARHFFT